MRSQFAFCSAVLEINLQRLLEWKIDSTPCKGIVSTCLVQPRRRFKAHGDGFARSKEWKQHMFFPCEVVRGVCDDALQSHPLELKNR